MTPDQFITRWQNVGGSERANYQLFIADLCALLDLPKPDPAQDDTRDNAYVFERRVIFQAWRRQQQQRLHRLLPARQRHHRSQENQAGAQTKGFDDAMLRARSQAENYARACRPRRAGRPS
jgi:hypothetical protein